MADPINVAVVGLGFMGMTHLRAYLTIPGVRVAAVCGRNRLPVDGVLSGVAGNIQQAGEIRLDKTVKTFRRLEDLLADPEINLVDICTPTAMHPQQVIAALRAGKHVICEKPLAGSSAAAREIVKVSLDSKKAVMPAMCMRFWSGWNSLKKIVEDQVYGKVLAAHFSRLSEMPSWSRGDTYQNGADCGGALYDLHIHDSDFVNFLFGRPDNVFSNGVRDEKRIINHVMTQYSYANGPVVSAEGGWLLASGFHMAYTILCERATISFDLARGSQALVITEKGQTSQTVELPATDGYCEELQYFVNCLKENVPFKIVTAQDAVTALEICEAEEKSIITGQIVKL